MNARVSDLARPAVEMRFHLRPRGEVPAGDRVRLDVADTALVLAFGAGTIRCAGPDPKPPMPGEGVQPWMQHHLPAGRIMMQDQRPRIVEQHFRRHSTEAAERALHAVEPALLLLVAISAHVQAARIAERCDEE